MYTFRGFGRAIKVGFICILMGVMLTGCEFIPEDIQANLQNVLAARANQNIEVATDLYNSGIITEDTFNRLVNGINRSLTDLGKQITTSDGNAAKNLLKACVDWRVVPYPEGSTVSKSDWDKQFLTNIMANKGKDFVTSNVPVVGGNGLQIKPIEVISESLLEEINTQLSIPVWVLKKNVDGAVGIDGIMEAVKQAETNKSEAGLSHYFEAATYNADGVTKQLTLMDTEDHSEQLVTVTSGAGRASEPFKVTTPYDGILNASTATFPSGNDVGTDLTISTGGEKIISVRLVEFNREALDKLNERIGLSNRRYLVLNNRAYLLEYPVGYISGFTETNNGKSYASIISRSELGFNLLTGDLSKFSKNERGELTNSSVITDSTDSYLSFDGAASSRDETKASLVIYGQTGIDDGDDYPVHNLPWNIKMGGAGENLHPVSMGRIVLRDYLEATYAPGVIGSDSLIVLGRKLRVLQLEGSKNNIVAQFYDKEGNKLGGHEASLYIDDFADINAAVTQSEVWYITKLEESGGGYDGDTPPIVLDPDYSGESDEEDSDEEVERPSIESGITSGAAKVDSLPTKTKSLIKCSTTFPGTLIGYSDYNATDSKPLFYSMFVRANMFETGLFSGWVQSTDQSKNSTVWWNDWLGVHGYSYDINNDTLVSFLKGNYAHDLSKEGVVILDLETIAKIQQDYLEEHKVETGHWLRTLFIVAGYLLIAYSLLLMISWNLDMSIDIGANVLHKVSFGRWIAVKDYEELPIMDSEDTAFINFQQLAVSCLVIISLGIVLITVNIIDLILLLVELFGGIADFISKLITGVR